MPRDHAVLLSIDAVEHSTLAPAQTQPSARWFLSSMRIWVKHQPLLGRGYKCVTKWTFPLKKSTQNHPKLHHNLAYLSIKAHGFGLPNFRKRPCMWCVFYVSILLYIGWHSQWCCGVFVPTSFMRFPVKKKLTALKPIYSKVNSKIVGECVFILPNLLL